MMVLRMTDTRPALDREAVIEAILGARWWDGAPIADLVASEAAYVIAEAIMALVPAEDAEYGIYIYGDSQLYSVEPPTRENAERELRLVGAPGEVVSTEVGEKMQNAANHARHLTAAPATQSGDDECGHESWGGLMTLLREHWPEDIFGALDPYDGRGDPGPRIVALMNALDRTPVLAALRVGGSALAICRATGFSSALTFTAGGQND